MKNVYVDKKYAGGKTSEKPPRGMQVMNLTYIVVCAKHISYVLKKNNRCTKIDVLGG